MDQIIIRDILARGHIGLSDAERENLQEILINLSLELDLSIAGQTDHIEDTVSYSAITKQVLRLVEKSDCQTVEALAQSIAELCLEDLRVQKVTVRVEKPTAVHFTHSVGVVIERTRLSPTAK